MSESKDYPNVYLQNACKLFKIVKNVEKRDSDGFAPALKNADIIDDIHTIDDLSKAYKT